MRKKHSLILILQNRASQPGVNSTKYFFFDDKEFFRFFFMFRYVISLLVHIQQTLKQKSENDEEKKFVMFLNLIKVCSNEKNLLQPSYTVKLGYNDHGYNKFTSITNEIY